MTNKQSQNGGGGGVSINEITDAKGGGSYSKCVHMRTIGKGRGSKSIIKFVHTK